MALQLRAAFSPNPRVEPLIEGLVKAKGIELTWDRGSAADLHERHLRDSAHDLFEFSLSNYLITKERPRALWSWVAIPVFPAKATLGLNTWTNVDSGIETGADLRGRRFGIPDYTMTAGLWFRAMLNSLWDIKPQEMTWYVGREGEHSHGNQLGLQADPPRGVTIHWTKEGDVNRMIQAGEIDAAFPAGAVEISIDTGKVRRLFPDGGRQFLADFRRKNGFLPTNHTVIVQRTLVEKEPWVPEALFEAFESSKKEAYRRNRHAAGLFPDNTDMDWQESIFGEDPHPYGLSANRAMLEMAAAQSNLDGLTRQPVKIDELFAASLRGT